MNKKGKYIPGAQTLGVMIEQQKVYENAKRLEKARKEQELEEQAARERERQRSSEIKKRAVEAMANWENERAEAEEKTPRLQPSSFVPEPEDEQVVEQSKKTTNVTKTKRQPRRTVTPQKKEEKYYPTKIEDLATPFATFDPVTGKANWGQTIGEQLKQKSDIESIPEYLRNSSDAAYYDQLKKAYLDGFKEHNKNYWYNSGNSSLTKAPEKGGLARLISNNLALWGRNKNETEISSYAGDILKNKELRGYVQQISDYQNIADELVQAQENLQNLIKDPTTDNNIKKKVVADYQAYINDLQKQANSAKKNADIASTYLDSALDNFAVNNIAVLSQPGTVTMAMQGTSAVNTLNKNKRATVKDLVDKLNAQVNTGASDNAHVQLKDRLNELIGKFDRQDAVSREGMRKNIQELKEWNENHKIDADFLKKAEAASRDLNFLNPDTYLYGMSGVLGSSAAFNGLSWANTALSTVGGLLSAVPGGIAVGASLVGAGTGLGIMAAERENASEVYENVSSVFGDKLRKSGKMNAFVNDISKKLGRNVDFDGAMRAVALGEAEPSVEISKILTNSTFGASNLFKHDMFAVTADNLLETSINFVPYGALAKSAILKPLLSGGNRIGKLRRLAKFKAATQGLSESAYNFGAAINPIVGATTATLAAATRPIRKPIADFVSKHASEMLIKRFGTVADWAVKAPKTLLNAKVAGRSAKDWLGRVLATSYSEAMEEGKQYYNGKQFAAGNYAGESDSMMDVLLGDIEGGSKSALEFGKDFLFMDTDKEWITNMRGGFLAGGGHTAIVSGVGNAKGTIAQIDANNLVINNVLATKLQERATIAKGIQYANKSSFADRQAMNKAFDDVKALQQEITKRGKELNNPEMEGIADELIEDQRKMYNRIFNLANSNSVKKAAQKRGIEVGSDKYNTIVSLLDFADQEGLEALRNISNKQKDVSTAIAQTLWGKNVEELTDAELGDIIDRNGIKPKYENVTEFGPNRSGEWLRSGREASLRNISNFVDYIAHLDALMTYRDQLELKDNKTAADKRKLRSINKQLDNLRNSVKTRKTVTDNNGNEKEVLEDNELSKITTAQELQKYVYDLDLHEVVRDQYRDITNFTIDLDTARALRFNLVGDDVPGSQRVSDEYLNDILGNVYGQASEYTDAAKALTDNKNVKIGEDGVSHGELDKKAAKRADKVINDYLKAVKDDEQFEQEIHDDINKAIDELYGKEESPILDTKEPVSVDEEEISVEMQNAVNPQPEKTESKPEDNTPVPLPQEMEAPNRVIAGDINDYIEAFQLKMLSDDEVSKLSQDVKDNIKTAVDLINQWIKLFNESMDEKGTIDATVHSAINIQWQYVQNYCNFVNMQIDAQLILAASAESEPSHTTSEHITEEQVVESETTEHQKYLDDIKAAIESSLQSIQSVIQAFTSEEGNTFDQDSLVDVRQDIANMDAILNSDDAEEALGSVYQSYYNWYFNTARDKILALIQTTPEELPEPEIQVAVVSPDATKFNTEFIDDPDNWSLLTNTRWSRPGMGGGVVDSIATDGSGVRLVDVISDHNFINDATFELVLHTEDNMKNGNQPFLIVHYNGHTFTPVFVQTASNQNRQKGKDFWNKIRIAQQMKGDGQIVVPVKVSRTLGKEKRTDNSGNQVTARSLLDVGLITEDNMYELELSSNQDVFGITQEVVGENGIPTTIVYTPTEGNEDHVPLYPYSNSNHSDKPAPGVPIMLIDRHYDELSRKARVPVNLMFTKLTLDDATLIAEILKGKHCANKNAYGVHMLAEEYVQLDERGNLIGYGMTNMQVLNLLLRYGYKYPEDRRHVHVEYNNEDNRKVSIVGFIDGQSKFDPNKPDEIPSKEYNLFLESEYNAFINDIAGVINRRFDQTAAASRVGEKYTEATSTNPFRLLNEKRRSSASLQDILKTKGKIQFGNSSIEFDEKDFEQPGNKDSEGVSGMVWYARHGFLQTRFNGFENTILVFDEDAGVKIINANQQQSASLQEQNEALYSAAVDPTPAEQETKVEAAGADVSEQDILKASKKSRINEVDDDELAKIETSLPSDKERIDLEEAKKNISRILGDNGFKIEAIHLDRDVQDMINLFKNGPQSLGLASTTMIKLSKYARRGTEYHEAFHVVVEMLLSEKDRQKVYKAYAKAKKIKLGSIESQKRVTEGLADEFMMYCLDKPTIKLTWNIKQLWHSIKNWINFFNTIGSVRLYKLYKAVNSGKYANMQPTEESKKRFSELTKKYGTEGYLPFSVNGKAFKNIITVRQYKNLCETMKYILFQSQKNIDRAGRNMQDFKMDDPNVIRQYSVFKKYAQQEPALEEMLDNWDIVKADVRTLVEHIATPYIGTNDNEQNVEDVQGDEESAANAGIGDYTRDSAEFSQFSRAGEKVKFFFSVIPNVKFVYDKQGKRHIQAVNNAEGLPQFEKPNVMYNTVLNQVYNCRSLDELIARLETCGQENAKFSIVADRIKMLKESADKGNVEDATLLTQMMVNLHASKGEYVICKATKDNNGFNLTIQSTDTDYEARNYRREWSGLFAGGANNYIQQDQNGNYVMKGSFKPSVFSVIANYLINFADAVSPMQKELIVAVKDENNRTVARKLDVRKPEDLALAKAKFISLLNALGITFNVDMLNYMLSTKYGSTDYQAMNKFFSEATIKAPNGRSINVGVRTFASYINGFNNNGKLNVTKTDAGFIINGTNIQSVFTGKGSGFVGQLATWAYNYKKSQDQLSILANKQNRQYLISENNYLTDTIDEMNASIDGNTEKIDDLKSFVYNWPKDNEDATCSTIILRNYSSKNPKKLKFVTNSGFKTDTKGDIGEDYAEISPAQDEVSKIQMLLKGKIILPTLSDKKTWGYIDGLALPGLNLDMPLIGQFINTAIVKPNGSYTFTQSKEVLDQLRSYAILEHRAVLQTLRDVKGYTDENGTYHAPLKEGEKIKNYHKATVKVKRGDTELKFSIIQGARYSSMYCMYDGKGNKIHFNKVCDENGKFVSEEENIEMAAKHFFGVPSDANPGMYWIYNNDNQYVEVTADQLADIQRQIIQRSLQNQLRKQLNKAEKLGLIQRDESKPFIYSFKNKLLDKSTLQTIKSATPASLTDEQRESLAIAIIMNDVSCKSIMSLQETERIFSGHPAFYKWVYNSKGYLSDRSTDQHKRFGGLVSTGQNNAFVFKNLPTKYTVAEINDVEIGSPNIDVIEKVMYEGELRSTYLRKLLSEAGITMQDGDSDEARELANKADSEPIEAVETALQGIVLDTVKKRATAKINAFKKGINVADGATYITDDMCENLLKQVGSYGEDIQRAFKVLRGEEVDGRVYTTNDVREMLTAYNLIYTTVIGTQKYTAYGFRNQNGLLVPYYNKTALFPLFKALASGNTAKLYAKMKKDKVDMVMFNSAVKVGSQGSQDINFDTLESDDFKFNTYTQEYRYLRKQFNTDPKEKELMAMGTQMTKIIMSAMLAGRDYIITNQDGSKRTVNAKNLRDEIMDSINKLSEAGFKNLKDQLFDGNELDVRKFSKFLIEELSSRGASRDLLRAVSVVDENTPDIDEVRRRHIKETGKPELRVPLVALSGMNWIQSIINSKVNKSIIDINTPGAAFIQRSIFGLEGQTKSDILTQDEISKDIYEGRELQFRNENGSMDCVLSIDFFANIIPENLSFEEAKQWLIDNKVISGRLKDGTWSDADASIIGYRIPTQAQSSIHALRCVDVLPVVRDTVILSKEFTKITGSDFDIDKLFLSTLHYNKKDVKDTSGNILSRTISREFKKDSEKYYANRLILDYISLLKDSKTQDDMTTRSMQIGDASIDNDTKLLTDIVEDFEGSVEEDLDPYDTYSLWRNTSIRDQFITGKFGIGPFALNNNNHILTMLYGVKFASKNGSILNITGHESLCEAEDMYGESIMSWLSGLINAHVDVAKDPYISKLNVNKYTYNLTNLLIRTGFGRMTFYFLTQPIMKELATRVNNAGSAYGTNANKSKYRRQEDAENDFIVEYANKHLEKDQKKFETSEQVLEDFYKKLGKLGTSRTQLYESIFNPKSTFLYDIAKAKTDLDSNQTFTIETANGSVNLTMFQAQMLVYAAKTEFDEYADGISQLVKYCKIDTKKQGKNIAEQRDFARGYRRLFDNRKSKLHLLFEESSLESLRRDSYIQTKTSNALRMFSQILSDQLIDATYQFNSQVEDVLRELPVDDDNVSQQLAKKVSDSILAAIRADYFNSYAGRNDINIKSLVSGNNTIYDRLNKIKIAIQTDDRYSVLRNGDGSIDNYLLNMLTSSYTHKQMIDDNQEIKALQDTYPDAKFIETMTFMNDDSIDADEVSEAWEELLEDKRFPELQEFARDLIVYSFITNGGNGGANNIYKYIPMSWIVNPDNTGYEYSFAHHMHQKLVNYRYGGGAGIDVDDIILNNWTDEQFIPTVKLENCDVFYTGRSSFEIVKGNVVNPNTNTPLIILADASSKYIKIQRSYDPESQRSVAIYKRTKTAQNKNVYVLVDPKGQNFGGKQKILEYGRWDSNISEANNQLKLNADLMMFAEMLGANTTSAESVLEKLISFVKGKQNKEAAREIVKSQVGENLLYDIVEELTTEDEYELPEAPTTSIEEAIQILENSLFTPEESPAVEENITELTEEEQKEAEEYKKLCEGE